MPHAKPTTLTELLAYAVRGGTVTYAAPCVTLLRADDIDNLYAGQPYTSGTAREAQTRLRHAMQAGLVHTTSAFAVVPRSFTLA